MFCQNCGNQLMPGTPSCPRCGCPVYYQMPQPPGGYYQPEKKGLSIASMVLGLIGLVAWLLPLVGYPVIIPGLILGIIGRKQGGKSYATAGIILCIITLVLTLINSALGIFLQVRGLAFQ